MKIRPIQAEPPKPVDLVVHRLKKCTELVRAYHAARINRNVHDAHMARLKIALYVPPGVYEHGTTKRHFAVYHPILHHGKKIESPERLFIVPVIPIREVKRHLEITDEGSIKQWSIPLIDTEGFLTPICADGYHGERYIRVGEIVTQVDD